MAERTTHVTPSTASISHVCWGSIFAGTVVAAVVELTLMLLGLAIGLATINPATEQNPFGGLGWGSALWWIISSIIALFCGGWIAARLAGLQRQFDGFLHGLVTWGLYTLLMVYFLTTALGAIVGGTFDVVSNALSATGQTLGSGVQQVVETAGGQDEILQEIQQELPDLSEQEMQQVKDIGAKLVQGEDLAEADRQTLVNLLTKYTDMSRQEATQKVEQWLQKYKQTISQVQQQLSQVKEQAVEWGDEAADVLAKAAFWAFIMLIVGAVSAAIGGAAGRVKGDVSI